MDNETFPAELSIDTLRTAMTTIYCIPTKPYSLIDAVNRAAVATGLARNAFLSHDSDYNGHRYDIWRTFHGYWCCAYRWSGLNVVARGTLAEVVKAAKFEYERGGRGSSVRVDIAYAEDIAAARSILEEDGFVSESDAKVIDSAWHDARYDEVHSALREQHLGAVEDLLAAETIDEYWANRAQHVRQRRFRGDT